MLKRRKNNEKRGNTESFPKLKFAETLDYVEIYQSSGEGVAIMSNSGKNICDHISNVRNSLKKAELSFRSNNGMRGELDLMLAEAELQHLREKRSLAGCWNRQRFAVFIAALLVLTGAGGWFWAKTSLPELPKDIVVAREDVLAANKNVQLITAKNASELEYIKIKAQEQEEQKVVPQVKEHVEKTVLQVPEKEIHNLVRTARKTLSDSNLTGGSL